MVEDMAAEIMCFLSKSPNRREPDRSKDLETS